jgi:hypothetical protein
MALVNYYDGSYAAAIIHVFPEIKGWDLSKFSKLRRMLYHLLSLLLSTPLVAPLRSPSLHQFIQILKIASYALSLTSSPSLHSTPLLSLLYSPSLHSTPLLSAPLLSTSRGGIYPNSQNCTVRSLPN